MGNSNKFIISDLSENIFLIKMKEKAESIDSTFFISLSEYLRKTIKRVELIPAEESIAVKYKSLGMSSNQVKNILLAQLKKFNYSDENHEKSLLHIPVCYSEEFGLDIEDVVTKYSHSHQEVADLHSSITYKVKMIGFTPGFAYLGDLPDELSMPRLTKPRINLLPGSVGISGNRTGVYTLGGPGGWRIIGRTPKSLFDPSKKNPFGISTGMRIKFKAITKRQYKNYSNKKT